MITAALAAGCGAPDESAPRSHVSPDRDASERSREVQNGPLPNDEKVTLEEAKARASYDLPVPPTDDSTGELTGIWIDRTQVAFVWATDLTFYVDVTDLDEKLMERQWTQKVEDEKGWEMTTVRGHVAIGRDDGDVQVSNLTWIEDGLILSFVAPHHTLADLRAFAERIEIES